MNMRGVVLGAAALMAAQAVAWDEERREEVKDALHAVAQGGGSAAAEPIRAAISDESASPEDWRGLFAAFFEDAYFTPALSSFWEQKIAEGGAQQGRSAVLSGWCAGEAIGKALERARFGGDSAAFQSYETALSFLHRLSGAATGQAALEILEGVGAATAGHAAGVVPALGMPMAPDAPTARAGMQLGLTLAEFGRGSSAGRAAVGRALGLGGPGLTIWQNAGILVFDNTALTTHHAASLQSLLAGIPMALHTVTALIAPEATGVQSGGGDLATSGRIIYFSPVSMEAHTDPGEFSPNRPQPVAPQFTIRIAQDMVRAIQDKQLQLRPGLALRRDGLLLQARDRRDRYLRQTVPPAWYLDQPAELFPSLAVLYFIDSHRMFQMALDFFHLGVRETLDQFLLLADLMSGGGPSTVLYATDARGNVVHQEVPVGRTQLTKIRVPTGRSSLARGIMPVGIEVVTAIQIGGSTWRFELNERGNVTRYRR